MDRLAINSGWRWLVSCTLLLAACGHTREVGDGATTTPVSSTSASTTTSMTTSATTTSLTTTSLTTTTSTTSLTTTSLTTTSLMPSTTVAQTVAPIVSSTTIQSMTTLPPTTARPPATTSPPPGASTLVWRLPILQKVVAITFDAGSDLGFTGQVLDRLAAYGVSVTFGITGDWAEAHPDAVRRMAAEGH